VSCYGLLGAVVLVEMVEVDFPEGVEVGFEGGERLGIGLRHWYLSGWFVQGLQLI